MRLDHGSAVTLAPTLAIFYPGPAEAVVAVRVPSTGAAPSTTIPNSGNPTAEQEQRTTAAPSANGTQEVVVTGFRNSLRNAITAKRNSDEIVESISSEDIGKPPDNSIAESLARLPGVTAQRLDGRDSVISIRGLSPDFTTTLLNGREQVSTGDNRTVEFDQTAKPTSTPKATTPCTTAVRGG